MEVRSLQVAKYIIENQKNIKDTAIYFGVSERTIQLDINDRLKKIDLELYDAVRNVLKELELIGKKLGGQNGIKLTSYSNEKIEALAVHMIENKMSLSEAATFFNIPKSTLYELLTIQLKNTKLKQLICELFEFNKENNQIGVIKNRDYIL